ncbi:hypothetical protein [Burkholderia contaminans]|uniref:Uncharacterized protein n=1 Tax=Burkholderia contaminans TaxID=488447 RepID=A0A6P3BGM9_9BURK|nr:hypothetical protein [Burkholderia contaminans]VWD55878.1 hypothetical protein BCO71033_05865 [Burkholderia contaminans]
MSLESGELAAFLSEGQHFSEFASRLIDTGWVADSDIGAKHDTFVRGLRHDELAPLCKRFGYHDLMDMNLQAIAFRHGDSGHTYYIFDAREFGDFHGFREALRRAGHDV